MDLNMMTTSELKELQNKLNEDFEKSKEIINEHYKLMLVMSEKYEEITKIINKREGNNDK